MSESADILYIQNINTCKLLSFIQQSFLKIYGGDVLKANLKNAKSKVALIIIFAVLLLYLNLDNGKVFHVNKNIGKSETYTKNDIKGAMNTVKFYFFFFNRGCTLKDLWYDEAQSLPVITEMKNNGKVSNIKNAIIIMSNFDPGNTGRTDGDGYSWFLTRLGDTGFWTVTIHKSGQG